MKDLRDRYNQLELDIFNKFAELVKDGREFSFIDNVTDENDPANEDDRIIDLAERGELDILPTIERRNEHTGDTIESYVISASNSSICVIDSDSDLQGNTKLIKFTDLADTRDKLSLLDEMAELKK